MTVQNRSSAHSLFLIFRRIEHDAVIEIITTVYTKTCWFLYYREIMTQDKIEIACLDENEKDG